jgi:hypothetical protein
MSTQRSIRLIQEGGYAAEVEVELIPDDGGWGPYLTVSDVQKLEQVRAALRRGDLKSAGLNARIYSLTPIAV